MESSVLDWFRRCVDVDVGVGVFSGAGTPERRKIGVAGALSGADGAKNGAAFPPPP